MRVFLANRGLGARIGREQLWDRARTSLGMFTDQPDWPRGTESDADGRLGNARWMRNSLGRSQLELLNADYRGVNGDYTQNWTKPPKRLVIR